MTPEDTSTAVEDVEPEVQHISTSSIKFDENVKQLAQWLYTEYAFNKSKSARLIENKNIPRSDFSFEDDILKSEKNAWLLTARRLQEKQEEQLTSLSNGIYELLRVCRCDTLNDSIWTYPQMKQASIDLVKSHFLKDGKDK